MRMLPTHYRQFVGCDLDSKRIPSSLSKLDLVSARQVLSKELDNAVDDNVQQAASMFVEAINELDQRHRVNVWESSAEFYIMLRFPLHTICPLST